MNTPLPVAALLRRVRNAKSPKEQHDSTYFAWEASIRLAQAAYPPADVTELAMPSVGHFVGAVSWSEELHSDPPLVALMSLLSDVGLGQKSGNRPVTARKLLLAIPAYRNKVIGHSSTRAPEFYAHAGRILLEGIEVAWQAGFFFPVEDSRLVFVESVEVATDRTHRARIMDLSGQVALLERGGQHVPPELLPGRVYLRERGRYRSLHPWLIYQEAELRERVFFFNGRTNTSAQYLDYVSGELVRGKALVEAFPGIMEDLARVFLGLSEPSPASRPDPQRFGDYRLLGRIGEGGMGTVYLASQESLERLVALKMLPSTATADPTAVSRFEREITALSRCDHPNVVKILSSGQEGEQRYYAMEFVEGADLGQLAAALSTTDDFNQALLIASEKARRARESVLALVSNTPHRSVLGSIPSEGGDRIRRLTVLFRDAARALDHLHSQGILHRDLKPDNLMVTAADQRVVVMDLGLAALDDASHAITKDRSSLLGTLRYMAPEQFQRNLVDLDERADVYSLGATFYELFCRQRLFDSDNEARLIHQILHKKLRPAHEIEPQVPHALSDILSLCLSKDRELRYKSAAVLAAALEAWLEGRDPSKEEGLSRGALLAGLGVATLLLGVLGLILPNPRCSQEADITQPDAGVPARVGAQDAPRSSNTGGPGKGPLTNEPAQAASHAMGKLDIASSPVPAEIYVDDDLKGLTPKTLDVPANQDLKIMLSAKGYRSKVHIVKVMPGQLKTLAEVLLQISSRHSDAGTGAEPAKQDQPRDLTKELVDELPRN